MAIVNGIKAEGQVLDESTKERIPDVRVRVWDELQTKVLFETRTDEKGEFVFNQLFDGRFTFTFEREDYVGFSFVAIIPPSPNVQTLPPVFLSKEFQPIPDAEFTPSEKEMIRRLRDHLKDNRPELYQLDQKRFRWEDMELFTYLTTALADVNAWPPRTSFTFDDVVNPKQESKITALVTLGGLVFALIANATLEMHNQFSYSDNGLSLTIQRGSLFQSLAQQVASMYLEMKKTVKESMYPVPSVVMPAPIPFRIRTFAPRQFRVR